MDWDEELQHLRNQLNPLQVGSCYGYDMRQKKRDTRIQQEELRQEEGRNKLEKQENMLLRKNIIDSESLIVSPSKCSQIEDSDFVVFKEIVKKINVMGPVSRTADARGLSMRDRTAMAASVANCLGVDVKKTNINVGSAWKKTQIERVKIAEKVKNNFNCPERVAAHWVPGMAKL